MEQSRCDGVTPNCSQLKNVLLYNYQLLVHLHICFYAAACWHTVLKGNPEVTGGGAAEGKDLLRNKFPNLFNVLLL